MFKKFKKVLKKYDPEREAQLREDIEREGGIEKKDMPAMILSAYLTFMPVVIGLLLVFVLVAWLFVR